MATIGAFDLRTGARIDLPKTSSLSITSPPDPHEEHVVLAADGETGQGTTYYRWSDEAYEWIELASFSTCSSARQRNGRFEVLVTDCESYASGELWLADFDGSEPVLVASDLSSDSLTLEDRVVWYPADTTDDPFHDLMVGELYGEGRWRLDTRTMLVADPVREPDLGGDVLYTVFDGERSGLWRSALP